MIYNVHLISHCTYLIKVIVFERLHKAKQFILYILVISTIWQIREITMSNPIFPESMVIFEWVYVPVS